MTQELERQFKKACQDYIDCNYKRTFGDIEVLSVQHRKIERDKDDKLLTMERYTYIVELEIRISFEREGYPDSPDTAELKIDAEELFSMKTMMRRVQDMKNEIIRKQETKEYKQSQQYVSMLKSLIQRLNTDKEQT